MTHEEIIEGNKVIANSQFCTKPFSTMLKYALKDGSEDLLYQRMDLHLHFGRLIHIWRDLRKEVWEIAAHTTGLHIFSAGWFYNDMVKKFQKSIDEADSVMAFSVIVKSISWYHENKKQP